MPFPLTNVGEGSPLQLIVDSGSQKNLVSKEVVKRLGLPTTPHPSRTVSGGFMKDEISKFSSSAAFPTASNHSQTSYCVMLHLWMFVMYH